MSLSPHSCPATREHFFPAPESQPRLVYKPPRTTIKIQEESQPHEETEKKSDRTDPPMEKNGVKVTYIETQFVTSDAAGFKSLVQRLTGRSPGAAAAPARQLLHRPRPRHADGRSAAAGPSSYFMPATAGPVSVAANDARTAATAADAGAAQPCLDELHGLCDYTEPFTVAGAGERQRGGSYGGLPY